MMKRRCSVSPDDWKACVVDTAPLREGPVFVGIDIGGGVSMTAIAFYWPMTGRHEVYGCFPATPSLMVRGKDDNVGQRYVNMHKRGELYIYPGKAPNNKEVFGTGVKED